MGKTEYRERLKRSIVKDLKKRTTRNTLRMQKRYRRGITVLWKNMGTEIEKDVLL